MTKNKIGIILVLLGIGVILIAFVLSSNYHPKLSIIDNIMRMYVVVIEGVYVPDIGSVFSVGHYEGRLSIPYKYFFVVGSILVLFGVGKILIGTISTPAQQ